VVKGFTDAQLVPSLIADSAAADLIQSQGIIQAIGNLGTWLPINVKRPAVLQVTWTTTNALTAGYGATFNPRLYWSANFGQVDPAAPPSGQMGAVRSATAGAIYFPKPGIYWVCNPNTAGTFDVPFVLLETPTIADAWPWLNKHGGTPGVMTTFTPPDTATPALVAYGWDAFRTALQFWISGTPNVLVAPGFPVANSTAGTIIGAPIVPTPTPFWNSPCPWCLHSVISTGVGVAEQLRGLAVTF
jgi:hypothetical protein